MIFFFTNDECFLMMSLKSTFLSFPDDSESSKAIMPMGVLHLP